MPKMPGQEIVIFHAIVFGKLSGYGFRPHLNRWHGKKEKNVKKPSWTVQIVVALLCTLGLISCGPSRSDSGAPLVSIEITPNPAEMLNGEYLQLKAIGHFADNTTEDITALVRWRISGDSTSGYYGGEITDQGLFKAEHITLTSHFNNEIISKIEATGGTYWDIVGEREVRTSPLESIVITPVDPIMAMGETMQFTATGTYRNGSTRNVTKDANWYSGSGGFNMVRLDELLPRDLSVGATAISVGSTIIDIFYQYDPNPYHNIYASTTVTVTAATLVSIAIAPVDPSLVAGSSLQFTATGAYSDGTTNDLTSSLTWTSSDPSKATISAAGLAAAVAAGTTIITATSGAISTTTLVTVGAPVSTPLISTGTMMKGSAIVNGIRFDDTLANITADDIAKNAAFLQSGMTVKIKGSRNDDRLTGVANEIHVENAARGAILLKFADSFLVVGQTVFVDGGTIFANVAGFDALLAGDNVEVYGLRNAAGAIRATRVERLAAAGVDEVRGTITSKFGSSLSTSITIGTGSFNVDETTTVLPAGTPFDVGTLIEIRLTGLHIDQLKVEDAYDAAFKPSEGGEFEVEGFITGFTGLAGTFFVDGQTVDAAGARLVGGLAADLGNDVKVEAEGHLIGAVLVADMIEIKH